MPPLKQSGVTGDKELVAALRELAKGVSSQEIDSAAVTSLNPMLEKTRDRLRSARNYVGKYPGFPQPRTPRIGGHVDEGIVVRKVKSENAKLRSYRLGATRRSRYLLHLVEFGTAPHFQPNFRGGWQHPGARANPALLPSFDEESGKVTDTFGRLLWISMANKIARLKKSPKGK